MFLFPVANLHTEPLALGQAQAFVARHHRHSPDPPAGHIFSLGLYVANQLAEVAICGRPVNRHLDDGQTIEVYRVCTLGEKNACSKLYAACAKIAKRRGFASLITYTLISETGASVRASNFQLDATNAGGAKWTGKRSAKRRSGRRVSQELKNRWKIQLKPSTIHAA